MSGGVIELSLQSSRKLTRGRLIARICIVVAVIVVLFAMSLLPNPGVGQNQRAETRKGGAPAVSERTKPVTAKSLHSA